MSAFKRYVQIKEHVTPSTLKINQHRFESFLKGKSLRVLAEDKQTVQVLDADGEHHVISKQHIQAVS